MTWFDLACAYFEISTVSIRVVMHIRQFLIDMKQFLTLAERDSPEFFASVMRKIRNYKYYRPFAEQFFTIIALLSLAPPIDDDIRELEMRVFVSEDVEAELEESYMLGSKEESHMLGPKEESHMLGPKAESYILGSKEESHMLGSKEESYILRPKEESSMLGPKEENSAKNQRT